MVARFEHGNTLKWFNSTWNLSCWQGQHEATVRDLGAWAVYKITGSLLQELVVDPKLDEEDDPQGGRCQRIRLSMTRRPLNKLFRRAVQCRDQSVVDRSHDRGHPNKVSMKKKRKKRRKVAGRRSYLNVSGNHASPN